MRERIRTALDRKVTMPRWAIALDFAYRMFLVVGAALVLILWYQAATRDEEADRNARIETCGDGYAATFDAHLGLLLREATAETGSDPHILAEEGRAIARIAALRIGLADYSAASVIAGNSFECPPLPDRLLIEGTPPEPVP